MSVCDVIPREEADFSAGDAERRARRPRVSVCLSACLPACLLNAGKKPGSICSEDNQVATMGVSSATGREDFQSPLLLGGTQCR